MEMVVSCRNADPIGWLRHNVITFAEMSIQMLKHTQCLNGGRTFSCDEKATFTSNKATLCSDSKHVCCNIEHCFLFLRGELTSS